jgi:soluble cytochrome b562
MKIRLLSLAALCAVVVFARLQAEETPSAPKAAETTKTAKSKEEHTELGSHMEELGKVFRRLNRQIGDASKNEDSLKLMASIREHAEAAMKLEPAKKAEVSADQQAKFLADYQAKMKSFLANIAKLESALKAGNNAEAEALVKTLKQDQKEGHKEFKIEEKKEAKS